MAYSIMQAILTRKFINGLKWLPGLFQGDTNPNRDSYQIVIGGIIDMIPFYNVFADARDTLYWLYVMYEDEDERTNVVTWIQLLITAVGWIPGAGNVIKIALKLLGKATDGFKNTKVAVKILNKLFTEKKLGNFQKFFEKMEWKVVKQAQKKLKSALEKGLEVLIEYQLNPQLQDALKDILNDFDSMIDQAVSKLQSLVNLAVNEDPALLVQYGHTGVSRTMTIPFDAPDPPKCPICGELHHEMDFDNKKGDHKSNSIKLRENMYPKGSHTEHPYWHDTGTWVQDEGQYSYRLHKKPSLAAHHLIPGAAMKTAGWEKTCKDMKYNINTKFNGVMFPNWISLACHAKAPLHRGGHDHNENPQRYTKFTKLLIKDVKRNLKRKNNQCDSIRFCSKMDEISLKIFDRIIDYKLLITKDGADYAPSEKKGCCQDGNLEVVYSAEKRKAENKGNTNCVKGRIHWYKSIEKREKIENTTGRSYFQVGS